MKGQNDIKVVEVEVQGDPFCDGCEKRIFSRTFLKFFFNKSGENAWDLSEMELHSHDRNTCIGKLMRKIFS